MLETHFIWKEQQDVITIDHTLVNILIMPEHTKHPTDERLKIALLLATNSGFVDAYTFHYHAERFASLQTGNIIQAGIALARKDFNGSLSFFMPILFFLLGAAFNGMIRHRITAKKLTSKQHSLLVEIIGISIIIAINAHISSTVFITLISFFLAIQLDAFPRVRGLPFTSVMSTGNLRNVGANLMQYYYTKNPTALKNVRLFSSIILAFLIGAFLSAFLASYLGQKTLIGSVIILLSIFFLLFDHSKENS